MYIFSVKEKSSPIYLIVLIIIISPLYVHGAFWFIKMFTFSISLEFHYKEESTNYTLGIRKLSPIELKNLFK